MNRTPVPSRFRDNEGITERQLAFINTLVDERDTSAKGQDPHAIKEQAKSITKREASDWITRLRSLPYLSVNRPESTQPISMPDVPAGRYAIERDGTLKFYRIDRPTEGRWAGYVFVNVQAGDELYKVGSKSERSFILTKIGQDPAEASMRYGQEIGSCGVCGRTMTNEVSRTLGIGPVCRGRMGW